MTHVESDRALISSRSSHFLQSLELEGVSTYPLHIRDGVSNSHLKSALEMFGAFHTLGDPQSIPAYMQLMDCFAPVATDTLQPIGHPESLWDQMGDTIHAFRNLQSEHQEQVRGTVDLLIWSLEHAPQDRKIGGVKRDVSPHIRDIAHTIGQQSDQWKHVTKPQNRKPDHRGFPQRIPLPSRVAAGLIIAEFVLAGCAKPVGPTISPDVTPPGITQQAPTETRRPATPTTRPATATARSTETPSFHPVVLFADMSPTGGAAQCAQNTIDLDSPTFDTQLAAMFASIRDQVGEPNTSISLRVIPGSRPGDLQDIYPRASFYFQSFDGHAPVDACGFIQLGETTARVQFVDSFPFPKAGGGTEPISFGFVSEPNAIRKIMDPTQFLSVADDTVIPALVTGRGQVRLEFYLNPYYNAPPEDVALFQKGVEKVVTLTDSDVVPTIFNELEAQRFSELFIKVFYNGDRSPEVLSELKALMNDKLIPGFIWIEQGP